MARVICLALVFMLLTSQAAFANGGIQGTLLRANGGSPMNGSWVYIYQASGSTVVNSAWARDPDGKWSISVPAGTYKVWMTGVNAAYASAWWDGSAVTPLKSLGTTVTVADNATQTCNGALPLSASLSGTVTAGTVGVATECNAYYRDPETLQWVQLHGVSSGADGAYSFPSLFPGTWTFSFGTPGSVYVPRYYINKSSLGSADTLGVTGGLAYGFSPLLQPASLSQGIHGVVHRANGDAVNGAFQLIYRTNKTWVKYARTNADGTWDATLTAGTYKVQIHGLNGDGAGWWTHSGPVPLFSMGETVTVSAGATPTIEATAPLGAEIAGTIRKHASGSVVPTAVVTPYVLNPSTGHWETDWGQSVYGGDYVVRDLLPGTYRLEFESDDPRYEPLFWNDKPSLLSADGITVAGGDHLTGYDPLLRCTVASDTVAGVDRMDTAVLASKRLYPDAAAHADAVILTTGYNWPDALGASALAGAAKAPVLLTYRGERALNATVAAEVQRLKDDGATEAYVLGDENAVGVGAFDALVDAFGSGKVHRLSGAGRYETSLKIAEAVRTKAPKWDGKVFLAKGTDFPDALAAAPLAAKACRPIVLAEGDGQGGLSARVKSFLSANATAGVVLLGDEKSLPKTVADSAKSAIGGATLDRWYGTDRIGTALVVAAASVDAGMSYADSGVATGWGYADALCGGPYLASLNAPLLLTRPALPLGLTLQQGLADLSPKVETATFLGGTSTVPQPVRDDVVDRLE